MLQLDDKKSAPVIFDRKLKDEREYWVQKLAKGIEPSGITLDYARPSIHHGDSAVIQFELDTELRRSLVDLVDEGDFLLYTTLVAALKVCLHKYSGSRTIVIGSPSRRQKSTSTHHGNVLAIVDTIDPAASFKQLLLTVRQTLLDAYSRQHYPFERLVRDLELDEVNDRCPLFDVALALSNIHHPLSGIKNDLTITFTRTPEALTGNVNFNSSLFKPETIDNFLRHYFTVMSSALENTAARIADLPLLTSAERHQLLFAWNDNRSDYPRDACIQELFESQVKKTPDALAIAHNSREISYRELNARANKLARHLRTLGVGPDVLVALCAERSLEMVLGMVAVLKAGGAFVALDTDYPKERLAFMLADSNAPVLLTLQRLADSLPEHSASTIYLDGDWSTIDPLSEENLNTHTVSGNLAYMIYTSGSTGNPKGVLVQHAGLVNLVSWHQNYYAISSSDRASQLATPAFDAYVWEVWPYLTAGASIHIPDRETSLSVPRLLHWVASSRITHCFLITALAEASLEAGWPEDLSLKALLTGGDRLHHPPRHALPFSFVNHYGPTESTVVATCGLVPQTELDVTPSIGRPLPNTHVYLLSSNMQPVPVGARGDLYIGGDGLARGYLNRPDLTAENFVPHPFSTEAGARLYRTGDVARYLPDGMLEFLGRDDDQVKIRGFRIELNEIEVALAHHPSIREAIVLARPDTRGDSRLVSYVVQKPNQETLSGSELRNFLAEKLPAHMIPAVFVLVESLPVTPNGKVDRRALPTPDWSSTESHSGFVAPRNPIEEVLAGIWSKALAVENIGVHHNFFEIGGHSLVATEVISQVREVFEVELPLRALFEAPTIAGLSERIEHAINSGEELELPGIEPVKRDAALPLSFAQQRLWFIDQLDPDSPAYNMPLAVRLRGPLNLVALELSFGEIVRRHETLRTSFPVQNGQPVQQINPPHSLTIPLTDLSELSPEERETATREHARAEARRTFSLATGPLMRVALLRLSETDHIAVITMHHIVCDAWSMSIIVKEMAALYAAFKLGKPSSLVELPIQYSDFAVWQRETMRGEVLEKRLHYWKRQLGVRPPMLELPTDRPRREKQSYRGATQRLALSQELSRDLQELSRQAGTTQFMTLLAAFKSLLHRYSGQEEIVVGTTVANRNQTETQKLIGFFVNMLVLRTDLSGNPTFYELLSRVREVTLAAYTHQDLPFDKLVEALRPERTLSSTPLFQVVFGLHHARELSLPDLDLDLSFFELDWTETQFDLIVRAMETDQGLKVMMTYSADLFDDVTIMRLLKHYEAWLAAVILNPEKRLLDLPLRLENETESVSQPAPDLPLIFAADQFSFGSTH